MSLIEFLFAEFSPRRDLHDVVNVRAKQIADTIVSAETQLQAAEDAVGKLQARVAELENDVGFLTLAFGMLLQTLESKSVVNREELRKELESIDMLDGGADGRFDVNLLRKKFTAPSD